MTNQILFLLGLYFLGILIGLIFKKEIPFAFICLSGFLWGSLLWVIISIFILVISVPYIISIVSIFTVIFIILIVLNIKKGTLRLNAKELAYFLLTLFAYSLVLVFVSHNNFSIASYDSIAQIVLGKNIGYDGFTETSTKGLASWGVFLPILQSASVFLGDDYLYGLQPAFSFSLFLVFAYISQRAVSHYVKHKYITWIFSLFLTVALGSTYFIIFQTFYIHNSLLASTYLFAFIGVSWLAIIEKNNTWLFFSTLAITGFSITRTESPLFALPFIAFFLSTGRIPYQLRIKHFFPYLAFLILWYYYVLGAIGSGSDILDPTKTWIIIASLISFGILLYFSYNPLVEKFMLSFLPDMILGILILAIIIIFAIDSTHILKNLTAILENMVIAGRWGYTWLLVWSLILLSLTQPCFLYEKILTRGIIFFFGTLLILGFMRIPFRIGWGDSANRIITHILPIILFYTLIKFSNGLFSKEQEVDIVHRRSILSLMGGGGIFVLLLWVISKSNLKALSSMLKIIFMDR